MTFSPLTEGRTATLGFYRDPRTGRDLRRYTPRNRRIGGVIIHHAAGSFSALQASLRNPARTLSCNYAMDEQGRLYGVVPEQYKANTSSSVADYWAATIEVANIGREYGAGDPRSWEVSVPAFHSLARWIADLATRNAFPINRSTVIGHREVRARFGDGVATRCPGEWLWPRMDELVALARKYQAEGNRPTPAPAPAKSAEQIEEDELMGAADHIIAALSDPTGFVLLDCGEDGTAPPEAAAHAVLVSDDGPLVLEPPAKVGLGQINSLRAGDYRWLPTEGWDARLTSGRFLNRVKDTLTARNYFGHGRQVTAAEAAAWIADREAEKAAGA